VLSQRTLQDCTPHSKGNSHTHGRRAAVHTQSRPCCVVRDSLGNGEQGSALLSLDVVTAGGGGAGAGAAGRGPQWAGHVEELEESCHLEVVRQVSGGLGAAERLERRGKF